VVASREKVEASRETVVASREKVEASRETVVASREKVVAARHRNYRPVSTTVEGR
jgi:hypothetical protein